MILLAVLLYKGNDYVIQEHIASALVPAAAFTAVPSSPPPTPPPPKPKKKRKTPSPSPILPALMGVNMTSKSNH